MRKRNILFLSIILLIISTAIYIKYKYSTTPTTISSFQNLLYEYKDFEEELPVSFCDDYSQCEEEIVYVTKRQALEDIDNLFSLLKFGYSGYGYFGGDETFYHAKDKMLKQINTMESKTISTDLLSEIIRFNLDFIQDSHFLIDDQNLCDYTKYFSTSKYTFYKDFKGFYTYIDDDLYYLIKINNDDV